MNFNANVSPKGRDLNPAQMETSPAKPLFFNVFNIKLIERHLLFYSFTNLNESRVIAIIAIDATIPMIFVSVVIGSKVGSRLINCHVSGIR